MTLADPLPYHDALQQLVEAHAIPGRLLALHGGSYNAGEELCRHDLPGDRIAVQVMLASGGTSTLTADELHRRAARFANLLVSLGVEPGDRVAGLLPRTTSLPVVVIGTLLAGAVYQPLFTAFGSQGVATRLSASAARVIVTDRSNRTKLDDLRNVEILVTDDDHQEGLAERLTLMPDRFDPVRVPIEAPMLMMFTSGTTGKPKGLFVPVRALLSILVYMRQGIGLCAADAFWNMADPGWAYGLYYGVLGPLLAGAAITFQQASFSVDAAYDVIRRFAINRLAGAPTAYRHMVSAAISPPSGVRAISSAGEPLDPATTAWLGSHFRATVRDHFGQTEVGMVMATRHDADVRESGAVMGCPLLGFDIRVLRNDGTEASFGEEGSLGIHRSSPLLWFDRYEGSSERPFLNDCYLTGDVVARSEDGSYRYVGRGDDVITSSGYRIGPSEIEEVIQDHEAVSEAAVIGVADPVRTERIKAFVVLAAGRQASDELAQDISAFVKIRLASHAYPREIEFVAALPKTASGKVQRAMLRRGEIEAGAALV